jgi:phosphotriesterase-related protein
LARRWITEANESWRPRFIKIGVNRGPLGGLDRKLARAAGIASRQTGLTIASHTGNGAAALEQLQIITEAGAHAEKFVWVHAQNESDRAIHQRVAQAGAWVEFDGIGPKSLDVHLDLVRSMTAAGLLKRTLISQDSGWYHVGEAGGGDYRGYTFLWDQFVPRLPNADARTLLWDNPRAAFGD